MVFQNQKDFSVKVHKRALRAIKEIFERCDKFEIKDPNETFIFNQVNHFYWDLTNVIFYLQQILIDLDKSTLTAKNLQNVLDELNTITSSMLESLKLDPKPLAIKLKTNVLVVGFQVERLTKIIELDDSYEYKQRILNCQLDLVIYTEKLKISMQFCNVSLAELGKRAHDLNDTFIEALSQLKNEHQIVEKDFSHYIRRNMQHAQYCIDYMLQLKNTGRFTESLNGIFKNLEKLGKPFIDESLDAIETDSPIPKFLDCTKKLQNIITGSIGELQKGHTLAAHQAGNKKVQTMMQEIMFYILVNGLNVFYSLIATLDDIMKT